jgi:hypothetical protein
VEVQQREWRYFGRPTEQANDALRPGASHSRPSNRCFGSKAWCFHVEDERSGHEDERSLPKERHFQCVLVRFLVRFDPCWGNSVVCYDCVTTRPRRI